MKSAKNKKSVSKRSKFLILFGFLFFINPVPASLDLLPDAFGCILLFFGLTQLAYFDGSVESSKKTLIYLFSVEVCKLLLMKPIFMTEIGSNRMLAATAFSIVEGIIYIVFFRQLFGGISYFAMRNNCNESLKKCDNCTFLSYLAFFTRIAATLLPELLAIVELRLYTETDFEVVDSITDILSAKPVITVLLSVLALGTLVAWFISIVSFFRTFFSEAGEMLDMRYESEFTKKDDNVRLRDLRMGKYAVYFSLIFILDVTFDGVKVLPAFALFVFLFASCFFFRRTCSFKNTKIFALPSALMLFGAEVFRKLFTPNGAIVIYETEFWKVIVGALIAISTAFLMLNCIRYFLTEAQKLSISLGGSEISIGFAWFSFCAVTVLWAIGFCVPYFYPFTVTLRYIFAGIFIYKTASIFSIIYDEEEARIALK